MFTLLKIGLFVRRNGEPGASPGGWFPFVSRLLSQKWLFLPLRFPCRKTENGSQIWALKEDRGTYLRKFPCLFASWLLPHWLRRAVFPGSRPTAFLVPVSFCESLAKLPTFPRRSPAQAGRFGLSSLGPSSLFLLYYTGRNGKINWQVHSNFSVGIVGNHEFPDR